MSLMVTFKNEVVRICPKNAKKIEASKNNGISWSSRYTGSYIFQDLTVSGNEILAQTDKGLYCSKNGGLSWIKRS